MALLFVLAAIALVVSAVSFAKSITSVSLFVASSQLVSAVQSQSYHWMKSIDADNQKYKETFQSLLRELKSINVKLTYLEHIGAKIKPLNPPIYSTGPPIYIDSKVILL